MQDINQVLIAITEANRLACAQNPHHQRLALVLMDNLVELQLRRKSEESMTFDKTTWYSGVRKYDHKRRKLVSRDHGKLLSLAVEENWITEQDSNLLAYAHRLRNHSYHEGREEDKTDLELGISLLFRFVCQYFTEWRGAGMLMCIPAESAIPIDDAMSDKSGQAPLTFGFEQLDPSDIFAGTDDFSKPKHWQAILDAIISFDFNKDVRPLIAERIENLVGQLKRNIDYLTEYNDNDFNGVLGHRFAIMTPWFFKNQESGNAISDPRIVVNIYLAVMDHEERLLDIADPTERGKEFANIVNSHDFNKDILSSIDFASYQTLIDAVPTKPESDGIACFLEVERKLRLVSNAVRECAYDLSGYTELMIDVLRGK